MVQKTTCRKCGITVTVDFKGLTYTEAQDCVVKMDQRPMECPGFHVELGGWRYLWRLDELLASAYGTEESLR